VAAGRKFKPSVLLRRKALRSGVFGGDRKWLRIFMVITVWRKLKGLFGFSEPEPVYIEAIEPGQRFVVAHEASTSRRKRRKTRKGDKKTAKKATKKAAKQSKKANKKAAKRARKGS